MSTSERKALMLRLLLNCIVLMTLYFVLAAAEFAYTHYIYIAAGVILGLGYVIYNKGFSGKDVTPEMLPDTMSPAEKHAFIEDSKERMRKSRWVLTFLIPILLTLACDMLYLIVLPFFGELLL
ncbi:MAG: hypothetical protein IJX28_01035 [Clostridia bacterium]|nr:hypothetical protein [Clostridia bacterium]